MSRRFLLIDSEAPMIGAWVSVKGCEGHILVSGMKDGDVLRIMPQANGHPNPEPVLVLTNQANGEHRAELVSQFVRAIREGSAGRVTCQVK